MSIILRIALLLASLASAIWIIRRIRSSKVRLEDTFFWVGMAIMLALLGIFPQISFFMAGKLGVQSPANFIFLLMIALLFEKVLTLSIEYSKMEEKYTILNAELALRCKALEDRIKRLEESAKCEVDSNKE